MLERLTYVCGGSYVLLPKVPALFLFVLFSAPGVVGALPPAVGAAFHNASSALSSFERSRSSYALSQNNTSKKYLIYAVIKFLEKLNYVFSKKVE